MADPPEMVSLEIGSKLGLVALGGAGVCGFGGFALIFSTAV